MTQASNASSKPAAGDFGAPPRTACTTVLGHVLRVFMVALTVAIPVLFYSLAASERAKLEKLQSQGKQTGAMVTSRWTTKSADKLSYQFDVNGMTYRGSDEVSQDLYDSARINSPLTVTYLPSDPTVNTPGTIQSGGAAQRASKELLIGLLCTAGSLFGAVAIEWTIRRDHHLCRYGVVVQGNVTGQTGGKNRKTWYAFTSEDGQEIRGSAQATRSTVRLPVGAPLAIVYTPDKPSINKAFDAIKMARVRK